MFHPAQTTKSQQMFVAASSRRSPQHENQSSFAGRSNSGAGVNTNQMLLHNKSLLCDQSVSGITHLLMPGRLLPESGTIEDYKNELKQCLRENISHKREIKQLRQLRKESEAKQGKLEKDLEDAKIRETIEVQKAVRKVEQKCRQLTARIQEMKTEQESLQKHNREYKEYFEKQQDRMNSLRTVNQNLSKKLQQKQQVVKKVDTEMELNLNKAEARAIKLADAL